MEKRKIFDRLEIVFIWLVALIVNIKHIFFSFGSDEAYTAVMGYRMVQGDRLFLDMWEPHQTSAIIPFILEKLFIKLTGSVDGIIVWLHLWGMVFFLLVSVLIIRLLKPYVSIKVLHYMAAFFAIMRPKNVNMPSYTNMLIIFTTLLWLFMVKYVLEKKRAYLTGAVLAACLAALSYPSNLLLVIPAAVIILIFSDNKIKDLLIAFGEYVLFFGLLALGLCLGYNVGPSILINSLKNVMEADSHYDTPYKGWPYFTSFVYCLVYILVLTLIACLIYLITKKKGNVLRVTAGLLLVISPVITTVIYLKFRYNLLVMEWIYYYLSIMIFAIVAGFICFFVKKPKGERKVIFLLGMVFGAFVFIDCMLLTNLPLITIMAYTSLPVMCSFIMINDAQKPEESECLFKKPTFVLLCILGAVAFQQVFIAGDQVGNVSVIFNEETLITTGPEKGIGSVPGYVERVEKGRMEWEQNVTSKDSVLLGNTRPFMLTAYMYGDFKISNYSTISTPSFNVERLEAYWELYPQRRPSVIAISCVRGDHDALSENLSKIMENYECTYKGTYWNFYRTKQ